MNKTGTIQHSGENYNGDSQEVGQDVVEGEARVNCVGRPRMQVTPTIDGTATSEVILDAGVGQVVLGVRVTLNASDLVTAGEAIMDRYPDVIRCPLHGCISIQSDNAIASIYLVGIGDATNTSGQVVNVVESVSATVRAAIKKFEFSPTDKVNTVVISLDENHSSQQKAIVRVEGYSHA